MKTLEKYQHEARKLIQFYGYRWLLNDDQNIGDVAHSLMMAEIQFNGTGDLNGYRAYRARCMMKNLSGKNKKIPTQKLNESIEYKNMSLLRIELIDAIDTLPPKMGDVLYRYYFQNKTYQEIGDDLNLTKQRINQILHEGLKQIREFYV